MAWRKKAPRWKTTFRGAAMFTGEGKQEGKLEGLLHLDRNVQPVQLTTRKVPIALREPLKQEMDRLSNIGVIRKVDTLTNGISALVVTTKENVKVRLCIDPKPLNENLHRNHSPLPTIDGVLPRYWMQKMGSGTYSWMSQAALLLPLEHLGDVALLAVWCIPNSRGVSEEE